jgi:hypothetical protein
MIPKAETHLPRRSCAGLHSKIEDATRSLGKVFYLHILSNRQESFPSWVLATS